MSQSSIETSLVSSSSSSTETPFTMFTCNIILEKGWDKTESMRPAVFDKMFLVKKLWHTHT